MVTVGQWPRAQASAWLGLGAPALLLPSPACLPPGMCSHVGALVPPGPLTSCWSALGFVVIPETMSMAREGRVLIRQPWSWADGVSST